MSVRSLTELFHSTRWDSSVALMPWKISPMPVAATKSRRSGHRVYAAGPIRPTIDGAAGSTGHVAAMVASHSFTPTLRMNNLRRFYS
ncbi:hypothetical protein [Rhodopila sp.]|jgi:hypothetical protein|uniref:hypothetical protein n=1 Tax=Rhodopila sp. TaxID=2480087 RepID=UPI002CC01737|nr:hypothetical protein [Rhodopila sp.]HVZ08396.1 hypothetical protein [Rhodopila sp.]